MATASPRKRQTGLSTPVFVSLILIVALLIGAGILAGLYYTGYIGGKPAATAGSAAQSATAATAAANSAKEASKPPIYLPLEPPLVVNFDRQGEVGYLQAGIQLMARQRSVIHAAQENLPMIRNNLLLLLSSQSYKELSSRKGKEHLRQETLDEVNRVLDQVHAPGHIEAVYFTAFVMQ